MSDILRSQVGPRLSQVVEFQGLVFLAGQVAKDVSQDIKGQTAEILATVDKLLASHGSDKTRVLQCTIYLNDMKLAAGMNEVWDKWVVPGMTPARATVEAQLASADKLIEITIIAAKG